jgi:hypothetical protein
LLKIKDWILSGFATFAEQNFTMQHSNVNPEEQKDFGRNWVSSSRFLFHVQLFAFLAFVMGGCYGLYSKHYKGKPKVEVQESSLYTPKYK